MFLTFSKRASRGPNIEDMNKPFKMTTEEQYHTPQTFLFVKTVPNAKRRSIWKSGLSKFCDFGKKIIFLDFWGSIS